jgi:hypothetical protein
MGRLIRFATAESRIRFPRPDEEGVMACVEHSGNTIIRASLARVADGATDGAF